MTRKWICVILCVLYTVSLCACGPVISDDTEGESAFDAVIKSLFEALDSNDADAIYALFSPAVQNEALKEQIRKLQSVYEGPVSEIGWDGMAAKDGIYDHGEKIRNIVSPFPVRCGDIYYWCYLKLRYEDTADGQTGIVQLDFYTADEYCIFRYDENAKFADTKGLTVHAQKTLQEEIRCISGQPHKYAPESAYLDIDAVRDFFASYNSFYSFKAHFGEPNAQHIYAYYELPPVENKQRYLQIGTDGDRIYGVTVVDDFRYIETVYNERKQ